MQKHYRWVTSVGALAAGLVVSHVTAAQAQVAVTVTVNASSSTGTIPPAAFGSNVGCGDGEMVGPNATSALKGTANLDWFNVHNEPAISFGINDPAWTTPTT